MTPHEALRQIEVALDGINIGHLTSFAAARITHARELASAALAEPADTVAVPRELLEELCESVASYGHALVSEANCQPPDSYTQKILRDDAEGMFKRALDARALLGDKP
jgi:hypothetical protein